MTKTKKLLSVLLSLVMMLSITAGLNLSAYAETSGDYEYTVLEDGTAQITKYTGAGGNVTIPSEIDNYSVTSIGNYAFSNCSSLTIPNSVTSIGKDAFFWCDSLTSIDVDSQNQYYASQDGVLFNKEKTELIQYPKGNARTSYTIPDSVTSIGSWAFEYCSSLTSITIPNSVTSIGYKAFYECNSLTSVTIPNSVTSIASGAFFCCTNLTSITIPNSVTSIGSWAFEYCSSLTSITIPDGVTSIATGVFENCSNLVSVTIPDSVTSIGYNAFFNCSSLTSISIPNSVTNIEDSAFDICENLTNVYYNSTISDWNRITIKNDNENLTNAAIHCVDGIINGAHTHKWNNGVVTKKATCTSTGIKTYTCTECGATKTATIAKTAHTYKTTTTKATTNKNGSIVTKCSVCGDINSSTVIYYPKTITLSVVSYTYNGKAKKPSVIVKDSNGNEISASNYTVTYQSGRKNVGKYTVTIKFKDNYSGTVKKTFTIKPKSTSISKLTAKSKGFTVKWKKLTTQTTGYQIQYSTSSKFTNAKTVTVSKNKTASKTISKLKAKKKYYVRVRTYKTVKVNGKNTKIYSSWSKAKNITTKK